MPKRPLDAAGLLLIRGNSGGLEILLGRRRRQARAFPGEYVCPGGLVEGLWALQSAARAAREGALRLWVVAREDAASTGETIAHDRCRPAASAQTLDA